MKQISSRFSIAVHILSLVATIPSECTGDFIAGSVNTNPVIIRKIIGLLKKAGFVEVRAGVGGTSLRKPADQITLLDVYRAVEVIENGELFNFHNHPNPNCLVGSNIEAALRAELRDAQAAMEQRLGQVTLAQLITKFK
ncbi:Rrf2 family transcriptional regulator [Paenibacillus marchantiophytorum]|uniref:Rrf2 family transcriptional regulator n=1 Tax=Paenibacillus marchantiophytorum TaxID=1619310 RepID=A0ABQ1FHH3_9BACL|nr:Rrf2 family transcriptional regulator [Paenibacillus marchantiophytorum]GGA10826.1 Rrf2 family transcriptional regulator [Paenibacillus marchantiophytorum]